MHRFRRKNKIHRTYEDFFKPADLNDPDTPQRINLTIHNFNAKGEVTNPKAPCVVTTIDPDYIKDAGLRHRTKNFRMKTDILRLREITRKKFAIYATQESFLEKQRDAAYQDSLYQQLKEFQEFAAESLCKMESSAFNEMKAVQLQLAELQKVQIQDELAEIMAEHQRALMEVKDIYGRFLFLVKLIGYFDDIIAPEDIADNAHGCKLPSPTEFVQLKSTEYNVVGSNAVADIRNYMENFVRPYLAKRNHLNAEIWIRGYERTRHKIFNYSRRFTQVALLNHLVTVVHDKSEKTYARRIEKSLFLMDSQFLLDRVEYLKKRSNQILADFEAKRKKDTIQLKLNAILPVILQRIESLQLKDTESQSSADDRLPTANKPSSAKKIFKKLDNAANRPSETAVQVLNNRDSDVEANVEKLQWHLLELLQELEKYPPHQIRKIERQVRSRCEKMREASRRALVKQNRLQNWMKHFRKHEALRQKDADR